MPMAIMPVGIIMEVQDDKGRNVSDSDGDDQEKARRERKTSHRKMVGKELND